MPLSCCSEALNLNKIILQLQKIRKQNSQISQKKKRLRLEGTSGGYLVQTSCSSRVT